MHDDNLVWLDMEMSGLDPDKDRVLEVATLVTDSDLNIVAEGPELVVHQPEEVLAAMDEWNTTHHTESGLVERVRASAVSEAEAERLTLEFVRAHVAPGVSPLCGNTIGHDRRFLFRYMPTLAAYFHYRNIDVSTLKELARRWRADVYRGMVKRGAHRAMEDIRESVRELRHYREHFLRVDVVD